MLQKAYLLAKIGADTAENEEHFAKNLRKTDNYPTGPSWSPFGIASIPAAELLRLEKPPFRLASTQKWMKFEIWNARTDKILLSIFR